MCNRVKLQKQNLVDAEVFVSLSKSHLLKLTNHRKIPSSKYSGKYITFFDNAFCFSEATATDEEIEPP